MWTKNLKLEFPIFQGEHMAEMVRNLSCRCIVITFKSDEILVTVWWFSYFWCSFDLEKWIKFGGSRNFLEKTWKGWPEKGERRHIFDSLHRVLSTGYRAVGGDCAITDALLNHDKTNPTLPASVTEPCGVPSTPSLWAPHVGNHAHPRETTESRQPYITQVGTLWYLTFMKELAY